MGSIQRLAQGAATGLDVDRQKRQPLKIDRKHLRVRTRIPCEVGLPDDETRSATILDVSAGGLKFGCSRETIRRILPDEQFILGRIMDVEIVARFNLPLSSGDTPFSCRARLIHSERLAQDLFHIGVQFLDLEEAAANALEAYVGQQARTPAPASD